MLGEKTHVWFDPDLGEFIYLNYDLAWVVKLCYTAGRNPFPGLRIEVDNREFDSGRLVTKEEQVRIWEYIGEL